MKNKKYNILVTDIYLSYSWYLKKLYTDKKFNFFIYNKEDAKNFNLNLITTSNIKHTCKKHNIDLILAKECSINSFCYKPFSHTAKKLKIPFISLFDGIIDHPYAHTNLSLLQKIKFGIKESFKIYFLKYVSLSIRNMGIINTIRYMRYNTSKNKNRYIEDNVTNFINGSILLNMYPQLKQHKHRFKTIGLHQLDGLDIKRKTKKNSVSIIGQPWLIDNLFTKEEFKQFISNIRNFCINNKDSQILYRIHPKETTFPTETLNYYKELEKLSNFKVITKDDIGLNEQFAESDYIIGLFSSAIANAIALNKKIIIFNINNKVKRSVYKQPFFFICTELNSLKLKQVKDFYNKFNHKEKFKKFFNSICYTEKNTSALQRIKNNIINLIER